MNIEIDNETHKIVYIDYNEGIPFQVLTTHFISTAKKPYWRLDQWDVFPNNGDKKDLRIYHSGSGGSPSEIQAPHWADGYIGKYWIAVDAKFKGSPINGKQLKNPLPISDYYGRKSTNPFKLAEQTDSMDFCEICNHFSTDFCDEHKYWDEETGTEKYINN